jgi:hypothetical protein
MPGSDLNVELERLHGAKHRLDLEFGPEGNAEAGLQPAPQRVVFSVGWQTRPAHPDSPCQRQDGHIG